MSKLAHIVKWVLVLLVSGFSGILGAIIGFYSGIYLRTLLGGLFLAWLGFTVGAYLMFLLSGMVLRIKTARLLIQHTPEG